MLVLTLKSARACVFLQRVRHVHRNRHVVYRPENTRQEVAEPPSSPELSLSWSVFLDVKCRVALLQTHTDESWGQGNAEPKVKTYIKWPFLS